MHHALITHYYSNTGGEAFTVLDYGVTGDGVTDDYAALAAMITTLDALPGTKIMYFPNGTYITSEAILLPSNIWVYGESEAGVIIKPDVDDAELGLGTGIFYTGGSNMRFDKLTLDGRLVDDPDWAYSSGSDADLTERSSGIEVKGDASNIRITNVTAKNMTRNGICVRGNGAVLDNIAIYNTMSANLKVGGSGVGMLDGSTGANSTFNVTVTNLTVGKTIAKECIEINDGVHGLTINGFAIDGETKCPAISIHDHGNANEGNDDITIKNGTITDNGSGAVIFIDSQVVGNPNDDLLFEDITITGDSASSTYIARVRANVDGCVFRRVTAESGNGIYIYNSDAGMDDPTNVLIDDCEITPSTTDNSEPGIWVRDTTNVTITGTTVSGWKSDGVEINGSSNVVINSNCEIVDNGSTSLTGSAVALVGSGTGVQIINSTLGNDATTTTKYGLTYVTGYEDLVFTGNTIVSPVISPLNGDWTEGTDLTVSGNTGLPNYPNELTGYSETLQAWMDRCVELGNPLPTEAQCDALDDYLTDLGSLLARHKTLYFTAFGSRGCLRVNVIDPSVKLRGIQLGTTTRVVPWTNLLGWKSDGASYVNDGYKTDEYSGIETDLTQYIYISEESLTTGTPRVFGARVLSASAAFHELQPVNSTVGTRRHYNGTSVNFTNAQWKGLYVHTYDGTNDVLYKDGTKTSNAATPVTPTISCDVLSGARNIAASSGTVTAAAHNSIAAMAIEGRIDRVDDTDEATLRTAVENLKTATSLP